ncbi:MAG TPA: PEP-CTERM sorting domain-containing protein [Rhizomicrobium sp.]|nr:PEP-CTERM sorting domain-containing protein [Rhizomicrobium sp.]
MTPWPTLCATPAVLSWSHVARVICGCTFDELQLWFTVGPLLFFQAFDFFRLEALAQLLRVGLDHRLGKSRRGITMRFNSFASVVALSAFVCLAAGSAEASPALTGSLTATYFEPDTSTIRNGAVSTLAIGSTITCPGADAFCNALVEPGTLTASGLSITFNENAGSSFNATTFNGIQYSGLTFSDGSTLTGFTLDTDLAGLTGSDVSFTSSSIMFNASGDDFSSAPYHVTLDLVTSSSAVPEPFTLSLFGAGLAGAAALRRRRKAKA